MYFVPISDHQKIEDLFENIVELFDDIDEFYLFDVFLTKLNTIIDVINHLKNIGWIICIL